MDKVLKDKLRKQHDECKAHPFWKTFSNDFHADCVDKLKNMMNSLINYNSDAIDKCPHAMLLLPVMHNIFDCILKAKIMPKYYKKTIMETKCFGNYVMCLQTVLQIIHYYLDDIFDEDSMVIYEPFFKFDKDKEEYVDCEYKTYGVRNNGDDTYRSVRIISNDEVDGLIKWHSSSAEEYLKLVKYFEEHGQKKYAKDNAEIAEYHKSCVNDLKDNKGKHFIIK